MESMLSPYRVLDLAEGGFSFCGRILGDLGADVIRVENPGGSPSRNIGPFYNDIPDADKGSLSWFAFNANKRGITLNLEIPDGQAIFKKLVEDAHFVLESSSPGYMDKLGLGYSALSKINPRIVMVSMTPFGQTGPKAHYKGSDLVAWAAGGFMYLTGYPGRAPVMVGYPQAYISAGGEGASGGLIAHWQREMTGEGQHVDVSAQDCGPPSTHVALLYWEWKKSQNMRAGSYGIKPNGLRLQSIFPCKDGFVGLYLLGMIPVIMKSNETLMNWMVEEGTPNWVQEINWTTYASDFADDVVEAQKEIDRVEAEVTKFLLRKTKDELFEQARVRGIFLAPCSTAEDLAKSPQLKARDFWVDVYHPELDTNITYPGAFAKFSENPISIVRRAPLIGEHNDEIYRHELGFSKDRLVLLKEANVI